MVEQDRLDVGKIEDIVFSLRSLLAAHSGLAEDIEKEVNYFDINKERMPYAEFRKQGLQPVTEPGLGILPRKQAASTLTGGNSFSVCVQCFSS